MNTPRARVDSAWLYEGVWAVLTGWFQVPREPPVLPSSSSMQALAMRPCTGWLRYRKMIFWITLCSLLLPLCFIGAALAREATPLAFAVLIAGVLALIVWGLSFYMSIYLGFDTTWYVLSDRALRIRRGVWTIHETTITFDNVQNVKISQGPLQRLLGYSDLVIETAGGGGSGPTQNLEEASHVGLLAGIEHPAALREQIMNRVRVSRSAGLGDEHDVPVAHPKALPAWSAAHLDALRQIAAHVARLRARSD